MKRLLFLFAIGALVPQMSRAQRNCGFDAYMKYLETTDPGIRHKIAYYKAQTAANATVDYAGFNAAMRTTATGAIPVIFHFVLDSAQVAEMGGVSGIQDRITSQLKVLNDDFNGANADKSKVPAAWTSLFANVGITFGLAHTSPSGTSTPGYELRYVPKTSSFSISNSCKLAKTYATGGLDPWDNSKYLNIWVVNITSGSSIGLGVTTPPGLGPAAERGIAVHYLAFGSRSSSSQKFISGIDKGRTITHEMGHYFKIWHIWGDDGGMCPSSGGDDDGISDTPPQADQTIGAHVYPYTDICSGLPNGIMFMNYMDYSNDAYMYMFTKEQANAMNANVVAGGESYSLTQHPELTLYPTDIPEPAKLKVTVSPNPTSGPLTLAFDQDSNDLLSIHIINLSGQVILSATPAQVTNNKFTADLSFLPKGLYIIRIEFAEGIITRKIVIQ